MKLTNLSRGGGYHFPPCHMLKLCRFCILLECPLDLSALTIFSPIFANPSSPLIGAEPWYKTIKNLHHWDPSLIDAVIVSTPSGILGLPFLTRDPRLSAAIYTTEATARIGRLMMEELVSMHAEFVQFYGPDENAGSPEWMKWEELERLHPTLRDVVVGKEGEELGCFMPLYSTSFDTEDEVINSSLGNDESSAELDKITFICSSVVDSLKGGGSVLIPIGRLETILLLLEQISLSLESSNLKVPMFVVSSATEETLTFINAVPEWLCKQRQNKLFSGEALFGHVELMKEKKLHLFPQLYSRNLLIAWQEPCIVFSPHYSLRLGPIVHLLHRWHSDDRCLLILEQGVDAELALLPFKTLAIKVLQCSFLSGIKFQKVPLLLKMLQPKLILFPEDLRSHYSLIGNVPGSIMYYSENATLKVPSLQKHYEASLAFDLAFQLKPKRLEEENMAIARIKARLVLINGKYLLVPAKESNGFSRRELLHRGAVDPARLLLALQERGMNGSIHQGEGGIDGGVFSVKVEDPEVMIECV